MSQNSFKPSDPVSGTLYVGGMATNRWVVYRSTDHGANWSPCDSFDYGGTPGGCLDLTVDSMGNVFATGIAHDVKGKSVWITRSLLAGADKWFTVDVPGPDDLEAQGSFLDMEYTFTRAGETVAEVSKRWFSFTDTYGVDIRDGQDDVVILASTVVIDMVCHSDRKRD